MKRRISLIASLAAVVAVAACSKNGSSSAAEKNAPAPVAEGAPTPVAQGAPATGPNAARPIEATPPTGAATPGKARAETSSYVVEVMRPTTAAAGSETAINVVVKPKGEWHFNKDFPTKLTVTAPDGVTVAKPEQNVKDAVSASEEQGANWEVKFTSAGAGAQSFTAEVKFAVCTEVTCDPKKETLAWVVDVE